MNVNIKNTKKNNNTGTADIENNNRTVKIGEKEYELILTTRATKELTEKFGGIEDLGEKLQNEENAGESISQVVWLITLLANQSVLIHNLKNPQAQKELLTEEAVELLTSPAEFAGFNGAILEAVNKGMKRTVENEESESGEEKNKRGG